MKKKVKFKKAFLNPMELKRRGIELVASVATVGEDEVIVTFADGVEPTKAIKNAICKMLNQERWREEEK